MSGERAVSGEQAGSGEQAMSAPEKPERGSTREATSASSVKPERGSTREATSASPGWTGAVGEPTRLLLLRHGQTPMSVDRRYSGSASNPSLTDFGRRQARAAADRLVAGDWDIRGIIASPQARALETATYAAVELGLGISVDDDLRETDFGTWEGLTFGEAAARDADIHARWLTDPELTPPGGEAFRTVDDRVAAARRRIADDFGPGTFLVVSHVTPIKSILRQGLGAGFELFTRLHLDLASLSVAEFYADGPTSVTLVNDTAHLR
ncbi:Putative phosphoserine phosphatase 2 [Corynebacterium freneyi]|nr:histidine phosphatase family protein [Corynebacterium freneyi]WJZ05729.1 Putative phosphoserine phosphatase 2 [Corynebacterium freneyi]